MRRSFIESFSILLLAGLWFGGCASTPPQAAAGPDGGDVVSFDNGATKAELLANSDTGEVMVHTWSPNLNERMPIDARPITIGTGTNTVELNPYPLPDDPPGMCSRFYGQADWMRGAQFHHGWMRWSGDHRMRHEFPWNHCWGGDRMHGQMWRAMGDHRMGAGMMGQGMMDGER
jgi:hypothetical protein